MAIADIFKDLGVDLGDILGIGAIYGMTRDTGSKTVSASSSAVREPAPRTPEQTVVWLKYMNALLGDNEYHKWYTANYAPQTSQPTGGTNTMSRLSGIDIGSMKSGQGRGLYRGVVAAASRAGYTRPISFQEAVDAVKYAYNNYIKPGVKPALVGTAIAGPTGTAIGYLAGVVAKNWDKIFGNGVNADSISQDQLIDALTVPSDPWVNHDVDVYGGYTGQGRGSWGRSSGLGLMSASESFGRVTKDGPDGPSAFA